jgi:hypothetical protein
MTEMSEDQEQCIHHQIHRISSNHSNMQALLVPSLSLGAFTHKIAFTVEGFLRAVERRWDMHRAALRSLLFEVRPERDE